MNTLYENGFNNDKRRPWSDGKACQGSWREPGGKICPNGGFGTNSSKFLWRPLQLSKKNKSKNCFEILMAKEMGLDRAPWNFNFFIFTMYMWQPLVQADTMSYYVRSATRSCVITRGCKANIFRITRWQKNASYARSPFLYCYLSGTLAACNFSLARAKLYWTLCLEHFEAKAIENGGGGSYYGAGGRLSGQTGRYYYNWQLAKMKKFDSNVMANFDPFHGNWRIQLLISTHTLFWAWLTFETIELDQIRLNLD